MDWKVFFATFGSVFLAELGDKTQLVGMSLAAKSKLPASVFLGSIAAYAIVTLLTVTMGVGLAKIVRPEYIRYGAAVLFILVGSLILLGKI
ncbi:MAG: hypothetical protein AUJ75_01635 [Candidatus Omnitrophica bacterium CG1_02_49_10]|nr:MAG: hypothetical protein AUJ75_01635 [Candidatus Omnitrophica bacterium CG1_02_49_10]